jgi:hypothetical protein
MSTGSDELSHFFLPGLLDSWIPGFDSLVLEFPALADFLVLELSAPAAWHHYSKVGRSHFKI